MGKIKCTQTVSLPHGDINVIFKKLLAQTYSPKVKSKKIEYM